MNEFIVIMGLSISLNFLLMAVLAVVIANGGRGCIPRTMEEDS